ncbi:restriction endonuclease subunit S [Acetobacter orientalis]|uniref:restriction endonuclease subunit S n=1 Tax=Acetobacter orientalis TaxID=146474 RepID=UPI0020A2F93B|nr:restriction endonuclease subunit S [Acetobacter orientalis]MCP1220447.1 restriction endonuclease subunit S [Acetobacter orientalis]
MSFPKYPAYKESGVEWIGEIPEGWKLLPFKRIAVAHYGESLKSEEREDNGNIPVYGSNGIVGYHNHSNSCAPTIFIGRKGSVGALTWSVQAGFAIDTVYYVSINPTFDMRWLYWCLQTLHLNKLSQDTGVPGLSREILYERILALPSTPEQKAIAIFLDRECTKIDALIEEQERLIILLQEKRQAVISHAVTKGLEPNVPMKESGIEWIGEIPKQWEIFKLRRLTHLKSGDAITSEQFNDESPYPVFGGNGIRGYTHNFNCRGTFPIIGRQGALCGNITVSSGNFWASEHAIVVYPKISYEPLWMANLLENMRLNQYSLSAAQPGLAVERIMDLFIPVPPHNEQKEIVTFISKEIEKNIKIKIASKNTISLLKERRSALISAAVTGKIDVRTLVKPKDIAA